MKKHFARMAAALLAAILFFSLDVDAVSAQKAVVIDGQTNHIIYSKNAEERSLIASTTKIMTALIVCEQCNVLDRVRIPKEAVGIEGSSIYLQEGEILTVQELLYGLMLHSGNDAAVALAIYCGGTVEGFAQLMNDKARSLCMRDSNFENPHGLDNQHHYSTAKDLAILASYAMNNAVFAKTVSTKSVNISGRALKNHNKLLWLLDGAEGIKTGYTRAAGRILVSSVKRIDRRIITVTINAPDDWKDHEILAKQAFAHYEKRCVIKAGEVVGRTTVLGGDKEQVDLIAVSDCICTLADWEKPEIILQDYGAVYAPVVYGQTAGMAYVLVNGAAIGKVTVQFGETVEQQATRRKTFLEKLFKGE